MSDTLNFPTKDRFHPTFGYGASGKRAESKLPPPMRDAKDLSLKVRRLSPEVAHDVEFRMRGIFKKVERSSLPAVLQRATDVAMLQVRGEEPAFDPDTLVGIIAANGEAYVIEVLSRLGKRTLPTPSFITLVEALNQLKESTEAATKVLGTRERLEAKSVTSPAFLDRARRLDMLGRTDTALDLLYDSIDELMRNAEFSQVDSILAQCRVDNYSTDMLLGILTATLPGRSRLPARAKFLKDSESAIRGRGEYEEGLLTGL